MLHRPNLRRMDSTPIEPGSKSKLTSIRLGISQDAALEQLVDADPSVSRGAHIRRALNEYLERNGGAAGAA